MDNLRAALLRSQLKELDRQCEKWNELYRILEEGLNNIMTSPRTRFFNA
jgi:dTDP-4-amino-4,6-dideoxygalactose transaminase